MNTSKKQKSSAAGVIVLGLLAFCLCGSCARKVTERGQASYYANKYKGRRTASGQVFRQHKRTAASLTIPLGTKAKVTNLKNGKTVKVLINDRGPYAKGRIIDLSRKAARRIDMIRDGVVPVKVTYKRKKGN
jgi:rare lipoprotein A